MRNGLITASSRGKATAVLDDLPDRLAACWRRTRVKIFSQASTDSLGRRSWLVIVCSVELGGGVIAVPHSRRNSP